MIERRTRWYLATGAATLALLLAPAIGASSDEPSDAGATATPIDHLVVIFQENVSFDHYFGTYPWATNPAGEPQFVGKNGTPTVNGLGNPADTNATLLVANPNQRNPQRLDRSQPLTCDQDHNYTDEQLAYERGLMDKFVESVGAGGSQNKGTLPCNAQQVLDYYDGNTVTALWNYAQRFALNDNSYSTQFGPSTPGAVNLISGNTYGVTCGTSTEVNPPVATPCAPIAAGNPADTTPQGTSTIYGDPQGAYDVCTTRDNVALGGRNIGNLLNAAGISWGWFNGGFHTAGGQPACSQTHTAIGALPKVDYIPHHEPFQYYISTANPNHLPPSSVAMIGKTDQANHQYDLTDFWAAADSGHMPAVSFLKAPGYQDGHAGYSTPLDEQHFLVDTINHLQRLDSWQKTAVVILYDDSDGWYDHQAGPVVIQSQTALDKLTGTDCGTKVTQSPPTKTFAAADGAKPQETRCGYGMRQPFLLISPFARSNFVDNTLTDQSSVTRFIEDNWLHGARIGQGSTDAIAGPITNMFDFARPQFARLILDPNTGQPSEGD